MKKLKAVLIGFLIFFVLLIGICVANVDTTQNETQQSTTYFVSLENDTSSNINAITTDESELSSSTEITDAEEITTKEESATKEEISGKEETRVWIPIKGGKKYHSKSTCSGMKDPIRVTISEAKERDFGACGKCIK